MRKADLINIEDIKGLGIIPSNTDEGILYTALDEVHDLEIGELIGNEYLEKLLDGIAEDNLGDKDKDVLTDYIRPYVIYATIYNAIPYLHLKISNKGVGASTDATLSTSPQKTVDSLQNLIEMKKDGYKRRLINFFKTDDDAETRTNPNADTTSSSLGIYIPDKEDYSREAYRNRARKYGGWGY